MGYNDLVWSGMVYVILRYNDLWPIKVQESLWLTNCPKRVGYDEFFCNKKEREWEIRGLGMWGKYEVFL